MTVLVGVSCSDGVVIGADSAATSAAGNIHLLKLASEKIFIIDGRVIVAGTGQIGLGQRFADVVKQAHGAKLFQKNAVEVARELSALACKDFSSTGASKGSYGALVGAPVTDRGHLIEYATADFQPELKGGKIYFVSMGSGQTLAEPFMSFVDRTFWNSSIPDVKSAVFGVHWALSHTIRCAPGGVGDPICIATLTKSKGSWTAELLSDEILQEQAVHMAEIEKRISSYKEDLYAAAKAEIIPQP